MMHLFLLTLGCKPKNRHIEQHDIYFGIGSKLKDFVDGIQDFWKEDDLDIHIDAYRKVTKVGDYRIQVRLEPVDNNGLILYFVNLGGYKPQDLEEYHYKELVVARSMEEAKKLAKRSLFYKQHLSTHLDDQYAIDVDDSYAVEELLSDRYKDHYHIQIVPNKSKTKKEDQIRNGYFRLDRLK